MRSTEVSSYVQSAHDPILGTSSVAKAFGEMSLPNPNRNVCNGNHASQAQSLISPLTTDGNISDASLWLPTSFHAAETSVL